MCIIYSEFSVAEGQSVFSLNYNTTSDKFIASTADAKPVVYDKNGNKITNFVSLKAFGEGLVKVIGDYCLKGDLISVEAHATTENKNGDYSTALIVDSMHFLAKYEQKEEEPKPKRRR